MEPFRIDLELASALNDLSEDELCSFAEIHQDPESDGLIELYIYTCFLLFKNHNRMEDLERATELAEGWAAITHPEDSDYHRRLEILSIMRAQQQYFKAFQESLESVSTRQQENSELSSSNAGRLHDRAMTLARDFEQNGALDTLNEAIKTMQRAMEISGDYVEPSMLSNLGTIFETRFERTGAMDDLDRAIKAAMKAVQSTPDDHPDLAGRSNNLGNLLGSRFERTGAMDDLDGAIKAAMKAAQSTAVDHPNLAACSNNLGNWLGRRFQRTGAMDDLDGAIKAAMKAVQSTAVDHPNLAACSNNLGNWLGIRFERTGAMDDLDGAIKTVMKAVQSTPDDHPNLAMYSHSLGTWLGRRFERTGAMDDIDRAVEAATKAVQSTPDDHPNLAAYSSNLGNWLGTRFQRTGAMEDLDCAVDAATKAVQSTPDDHPDLAGRSSNLGTWLGTRFERTGAMDDLDGAIKAAMKGVQSTPDDHPDLAGRSNNLGNRLGTRFERTGVMDDLDGAVKAAMKAVESTPDGHPGLARRSNSLGAWLGTRFKRTGAMNDLDRAIDAAAKAVQSTPEDHPNLAAYSNNLGNRLGTRFQRTGAMEDLDRAVDAATKAVQSTPDDHPDLAAYSSNLGNWLGTRFQRTGAMEDLDCAVDAATKAVQSTPDDHPDLAGRSSNLGAWLGTRFERTGAMNDLDRAIDAAAKAFQSTPEDHPDLAAYSNNLGNRLGTRFQRTGAVEDLDRAVDAATKAVQSTPDDHPNLAAYSSNLGAWLGTRFQRTGAMEDLDRAVDAATKAVQSTPDDHPDLAGYSSNLGNRLGTRFERTGVMDDLLRQLLSYTRAWNCDTAPPSRRIQGARRAAEIYISQQDWEKASCLLQKAVLLLPKVSLKSLKHTDMQSVLAPLYGLASLAASAALSAAKDPQYTLSLLEQGRSVIAGFLIDMRTDTSTLREAHPDLAAKLDALRNELDSPVNAQLAPPLAESPPSWQSQQQRRRNADQEFDVLVERIRTCPGFDHFLRPPAAEDLMGAASCGPIVVVNTTSHRSDAFLVEPSRIRVVELPNLTERDVHRWVLELRRTPDFTSMLKWLWSTVCCPCLDALGFTAPASDGDYPRVWWVPTGPLSQLPLHAAGLYGQGSKETVMDRVMSSYALSIKTLIHGRQQPRKRAVDGVASPALLVAMERTAEQHHLPFAGEEVKMMKTLCPSLHLDAFTPTPGRDEVLSHLKTCTVFHFAGHGLSHPTEPSQSCLLLENWQTHPLTVQDLRDSQLQDNPPFLAYLSACSTGANKDMRLSDEGIHLVSAFQLAGFRHVIGTLWEVSDRPCVDVARVVYETLRDEGMTDQAVCRGLHLAQKMLRDGEGVIKQNAESAEDRNVKLVSLERQQGSLRDIHWIPYIHYGA